MIIPSIDMDDDLATHDLEPRLTPLPRKQAERCLIVTVHILNYGASVNPANAVSVLGITHVGVGVKDWQLPLREGYGDGVVLKTPL